MWGRRPDGNAAVLRKVSPEPSPGTAPPPASALSARAGCGARHRRIHPRRSEPPPLARSTSTGRSALPRMSRTPLADAFTRSRPTLHSSSPPSRSRRRAPGVSVGSQVTGAFQQLRILVVQSSASRASRRTSRREARPCWKCRLRRFQCSTRVGNHFSDSESKRLVRRGKPPVPTLRRVGTAFLPLRGVFQVNPALTPGPALRLARCAASRLTGCWERLRGLRPCAR